MNHAEFDLHLAPFTLEAGARLSSLVVRGWISEPGPLPASLDGARVRVEARSHDRERIVQRTLPVEHVPDAPVQLDERVPTVVVVHALTGDMRPGGPGGWWEPLVGPGRVFDTSCVRVLCFNNLGSCYGTSGPGDAGFPTRADEPEPPVDATGRGGFPMPRAQVPATVTPWDQARTILLALDSLGVRDVQQLVGGSIGGMITLCLAALDPGRWRHVTPIAACPAASPWIIGFNHIARQTLLADPGFPHDCGRGLELARQLAHLSYRAEPGLELRQGRTTVPEGAAPGAPYAVQTYLEYHGRRLRQRFLPGAYLAQLDAMDHHDLTRRPRWAEPAWGSDGDGPWGLARIQAPIHAIGIDTDALYLPVHTKELVVDTARGDRADFIASPHGHDAFLIEYDQLAAILKARVQGGGPI